MKWTTEAKVGIVTLVGVLLLICVLVNLGSIAVFGKPGFHVYAMFNEVNGLSPGNTVRYAGVNIGKVDDVVTDENGVKVTLKLDKDSKIPRDSQISLSTDGLVGEKIVQISPGDKKNDILKDGDTVQATGQSGMDKTIGNANKLVESATRAVDAMNTVIGDRGTQEAMRATTLNMAALTGNLNDMAMANQQNIHAITTNMVAVTQSMDRVTSQLATSLNQLDGDGATSQNVRAVVANMKTTTDRVDHMAKSFESIATDQENANNIRTTLHNTANISKKLDTMLNGSPGNLKVKGNAEILYNNHQGEYGANVNLRVYNGHTYGLIGADNIGNGAGFNLQVGQERNWVGGRIGLFEGQLGAGIDLGVDRPFRLSLEAYDPNDWRYKIKSELRIMPDVFLVGQVVYPRNSEYGGTYFGINHIF